MKIKIRNAQELILMCIALAGELPKNFDPAGHNIPITKPYLKTQITAMKKNGIVTSRRKQNYTRLKDPEGLKTLADFSEALFEHYMRISNNHSLSGSGNAKKKMNINAQVASVYFMMRCGCLIDTIGMEYDSNLFGKKNKNENNILDSILGGSDFFINDDSSSTFFLDSKGEILPLKKLAQSVSHKEPYFFSARFIKNSIETRESKIKIRGSRFTGFLLTPTRIFSVYYIEKAGEDFLIKNNAEAEAKTTGAKIFNAANPNRRLLTIPDSIVIIPDKESIPSIIHPEKRTRFSLSSVYDTFTIITDDEEGQFMMEILKTENYREKIKNTLYYPEEIRNGKDCDGVVDGRKSWELITCDYSKIYRIKKEKTRKVHVICFDTQKEIIKKLLKGYNTEFITIKWEDRQELKKMI